MKKVVRRIGLLAILTAVAVGLFIARYFYNSGQSDIFATERILAMTPETGVAKIPLAEVVSAAEADAVCHVHNYSISIAPGYERGRAFLESERLWPDDEYQHAFVWFDRNGAPLGGERHSYTVNRDVHLDVPSDARDVGSVCTTVADGFIEVRRDGEAVVFWIAPKSD